GAPRHHGGPGFDRMAPRALARDVADPGNRLDPASRGEARGCLGAPRAAGYARPRLTAQALQASGTGSLVVNFLVRSTKLVLTERTPGNCSTRVERNCSYAFMLAAT